MACEGAKFQFDGRLCGYHGYRTHGMRDEEWKTQDKIDQYKAIVDLYSRDKVILQAVFDKEKEEEILELNTLRKEVKLTRDEIREASLGDKQALRTLFCDHPALQRMFVSMSSEEIVEYMKQLLYKERKEMDLLSGAKKKAAGEFQAALMNISVCEDRLVIEAAGIGVKTPLERRVQELCRDIAAVNIKRDAAIAVHDAYNKVLALVKKDAIYYDTMVDCLRKDLTDQNGMTLRAVIMGQLASEYKDDLQYEVADLIKSMTKAIKARLAALKRCRNIVNHSKERCKNLTRTDSDILLPINHEVKPSKSEEQITKDFEALYETLCLLQKAALVPKIEDVEPRLHRLLEEYKNLSDAKTSMQNLRDQLLMQHDHGELMMSIISHTYDSEKLKFLSDEKAMQDKIEEVNKRIADIADWMERNCNTLVHIRTNLKNLNECLTNVRSPDDRRYDADDDDDSGETRKSVPYADSPPSGRMFGSQFFAADLALKEPINYGILPGEDSPDLIASANEKLQVLMPVYKDSDAYTKRLANDFYHKAMMKQLFDKTEPEDVLEGLFDNIVLTDSGTITYETIKEESEKIVKENVIDEDELLAEQMKFQKRPKRYT